MPTTVDKLTKFIGYNPTFLTLDRGEQELLRVQAAAMETYRMVLSLRIARATDPA